MAKDEIIPSINALAKHFDVTRQAITKWTKHPDWMFGSAPWKLSQVPKIKAWAEETLQENRAEPSPEKILGEGGSATSMHTRAKMLKTLREGQLLALRLQEKQANLHDIAECRKQQVERVHQAKNVLTSQVPLSVIQDMRAYERQNGRAIPDVELANLIRTRIEEAIVNNLAPPE